MGIKLVFESKLYIVEKDQSTLPNVNIRDPSRDKNLPIIFVTGSINQNVF